MSYEFDELRQENARLKAENMELRQKLNARNNDKVPIIVLVIFIIGLEFIPIIIIVIFVIFICLDFVIPINLSPFLHRLLILEPSKVRNLRPQNQDQNRLYSIGSQWLTMLILMLTRREFLKKFVHGRSYHMF
uniref:Uncharacterized protein n=1 Tax=Rhizophagus irregularis (strain DAOM 181602 / DAOM 197198 / MUCL 43194) TaxID=747089 RepID=U9UKL6_RHIID